jgi:hypothetical protein
MITEEEAKALVAPQRWRVGEQALQECSGPELMDRLLLEHNGTTLAQVGQLLGSVPVGGDVYLENLRYHRLQ